jgi:hypothetical protein
MRPNIDENNISMVWQPRNWTSPAVATLLHSAHTVSGAHPALGGSIAWENGGQDVIISIHLDLVKS